MSVTVLDQFLSLVEVVADRHGASKELLASFEGADLDRRAISMAITSDDAFAKSVLRLANSPYYRRGHEVTSVDYAVALLGEWTIRSFALLDMLREFGALSSAAWGHSSIVAISAFHVSETRGADPSIAYSSGLIHDVGAFVLRSYDLVRYHQIESNFSGGLTAESQKEYLDSELSAFGVDHAELGSAILEHFNFPETMVAAVRSHHLIEDVIHPVTRSIIDGERIVHLSQLPIERWTVGHLYPLQYSIADSYGAVRFMTEEASLLFSENGS